MPARFPQALSTRTPEEVKQLVVTLAGAFDDPISSVRIDIGPATDLGAGSFKRTITFTVIDRLNKQYPPASFRRTVDPALDARWHIRWSTRPTKYGEPTDYGAVYSRGRDLGPVGNTRLAETDLSGVVAIDITKAAGDLWVDAGVVSLQRTKGVDFSVVTPVDGSGGGPGSGGGGTGGTPIVPPDKLPDPPSEGIGGGSFTSFTITEPVEQTSYIPQPPFASQYLIQPPSDPPNEGDVLVVASITDGLVQLAWSALDGGSP